MLSKKRNRGDEDGGGPESRHRSEEAGKKYKETDVDDLHLLAPLTAAEPASSIIAALALKAVLEKCRKNYRPSNRIAGSKGMQNATKGWLDRSFSQSQQG
jgi:hypothetical protein